MASTSIESPVPEGIKHIPTCYHDLSEVFSKGKASGLPPHWPYECTIDLLPGTSSLLNCIHPLSVTKQVAMQEYVQEALQQGYIHPSTSPASAISSLWR